MKLSMLIAVIALVGCGSAGPQGSEGPKGSEGETGKQGATGKTGQQGEAGATGAKGPQGTPGPMGNQGNPGPKGGTGAPGTMGLPGPADSIVSSIGCTGVGNTTDVYTDVSNSTTYSLSGCEFFYQEDTWTDGSVFASAGVACGSIESSYSTVYAPTQVGYATAPVEVVYDIAPPYDLGYWTTSLNRSTMIVSVVYTDYDVSGSPLTWTFASSACTTNSY